MSFKLSRFSLRFLLGLMLLCAVAAAFYARHVRMNTTHPLPFDHRSDTRYEVYAPVAPVFYENPPLARRIARQYKADVFATLRATPPGIKYHDDVALRLLFQRSPEVLPRYFETWFARETPIQTLINATQIVYQTGQRAGIEKANEEIVRRMRTVTDSQEACELSHLVHWDTELLLPELEQLLRRHPRDPKIVFSAVMKLDEFGGYRFGTEHSLELPPPTVDLLKSWLEKGGTSEQFVAIAGLAHTSYRETEDFGDRVRARIANGDGLYSLGRSAFVGNEAAWVGKALIELRDASKNQPLYTPLVCKFGDQEFIDFYQAQILSASYGVPWDAFSALRRTAGEEQAIGFLNQNFAKRPLHFAELLLEQSGENAIATCVEHLKQSRDEKLRGSLIGLIVKKDLGKGNSKLLEYLETEYRDACETDFRVNAKLLLNALKSVGHPDPLPLFDLLPKKSHFEGEFVTMAENEETLEDFIDFLDLRNPEPLDRTLIRRSTNVEMHQHFALHCQIHEAMTQSAFAMELCPEDWTLNLDLLCQELVLLTQGTFTPDGIRCENRLEISWKGIVFADELAPYEDDAVGLVSMLNLILDHSGETDSRFVSYACERGNEYPTVAFLSADDVKKLETRFGLKPD